jgi:phosphoglycerol transferase MdoB-like AlkP superfamily enzyme
MKERIKLYFSYFLFWYAFFVVGRIAFLMVHYEFTRNLTAGEILGTFIHGFRLDTSMAGYLMVFPTLLLVVSTFGFSRILTRIFNIYTYIVIGLVTLLTVIDLQLYKYWGFRLDTTPLLYMDNTKAMTASVTIWQILLITVLISVLIYAICKIYFALIGSKVRLLKTKPIYVLSVIFLFIILILPIRGSLGLVPINIGSAYFSQKQFANHAAINPLWNLSYAITEDDEKRAKYRIMDYKLTAELFKKMHRPGQTTKILNTDKPNIIILIVESFTATCISSLGGLEGPTPIFNSLTKEGILFDNFYANGNRSDKAMTAVISGYPSLPGSSVIKYPQKTEKLDFITHELKKEGYKSGYFFGGSIDFANYRSYLVAAGFDKIISMDDFDPKSYNSKWGAWDHIVMQKLLDDTPDTASRFCKILFTLTSHEPFEIPTKPYLKGSGDEILFLNSIHYTDESIGNFIKQAKQKKWWDNTLVVIIADHGTRFPGNLTESEPNRFRIPMLWLGGALAKQDTVIHTFGSQLDISKTVLNQMGLQGNKFTFGNDLFASGDSDHFAYYTYSSGIVMLRPGMSIGYDPIANDFFEKRGNITSKEQNDAKAMLQSIFNDFSKK